MKEIDNFLIKSNEVLSKIDKKIESFFTGIEKKIISYKVLREEEKQKNIALHKKSCRNL